MLCYTIKRKWLCSLRLKLIINNYHTGEVEYTPKWNRGILNTNC